MEIWITAQECLGLNDLPSAPKNIRAVLNKVAGDVKRRRLGTKSYEYPLSCLPHRARQEILLRKINSDSSGVSLSTKFDILLTSSQVAVATARVSIVNEIIKLISAGLTQASAITLFINALNNNEFSSDIITLAKTANHKKTAGRTLSFRTVHQWLIDYKKADTPSERIQRLAPKIRQKTPQKKLTGSPIFFPIIENPPV